MMEMLDIKIAKKKEDFIELRALENLANVHHHEDGDNRYFGIARLNDLPVGYWKGISLGESFNSEYIFIAGDYRRRGFGYELEKHQLKFAKSLGCSSATSIVSCYNLGSLIIQEKCGGEVWEIHGSTACFTFDLKNPHSHKSIS